MYVFVLNIKYYLLNINNITSNHFLVIYCNKRNVKGGYFGTETHRLKRFLTCYYETYKVNTWSRTWNLHILVMTHDFQTHWFLSVVPKWEMYNTSHTPFWRIMVNKVISKKSNDVFVVYEYRIINVLALFKLY